jgi:hypothetical protein
MMAATASSKPIAYQTSAPITPVFQTALPLQPMASILMTASAPATSSASLASAELIFATLNAASPWLMDSTILAATAKKPPTVLQTTAPLETSAPPTARQLKALDLIAIPAIATQTLSAHLVFAQPMPVSQTALPLKHRDPIALDVTAQLELSALQPSAVITICVSQVASPPPLQALMLMTAIASRIATAPLPSAIQEFALHLASKLRIQAHILTGAIAKQQLNAVQDIVKEICVFQTALLLLNQAHMPMDATAQLLTSVPQDFVPHQMPVLPLAQPLKQQINTIILAIVSKAQSVLQLTALLPLICALANAALTKSVDHLKIAVIAKQEQSAAQPFALLTLANQTVLDLKLVVHSSKLAIALWEANASRTIALQIMRATLIALLIIPQVYTQWIAIAKLELNAPQPSVLIQMPALVLALKLSH